MRRAVALFVAVLGCGGSPPTGPQAPAVAPPPPAPPALRLGDAARPTRYTAELTVDPSQERFSGIIDIEITVARPLEVLWLNADELTVAKVSVAAPGGPVAARPIPTPKSFLGIAFDRPLPQGPARVHLEYTAPLSTKDASGASRQKEGDDWYVFTQFEPLDARRVFPCFDEPSFKAPWQLALRVRRSDRAFSNTAQVEARDVGGGWQRVQFAESQPLPSYLVAWAVGPFDVVAGGTSRRSGTKVRIIVPRGQSDRARWAAEASHQALERLEEYFGSDYPFGKLDCIAVPLLGGAMEHPGLVTFASSFLLQKPGEETIARRRTYADIATHEFAHMWFGDLVTMAWWDDLWLKEAFATWITPKIVGSWQPAWGAAEDRGAIRDVAMGADERVSARAIRQPITSNGDIKNAFDTITYSKGGTVIGMFERFVGPDVFRRGVQRFMRQHAHGNATTAEFLAAVSAEAGRDLAPAFASFLDQPGVPIVDFEPRCERGRTPALRLRQQRFLPRGSPGGGEAQLWQIPVCVRWADGRACTLLTSREGDLELTQARRCPAWIEPNDGGTNCYRSRPSAELLGGLQRVGLPSLSAPEKMALLSDLTALVRAGGIELSAVLELAPRLASDANRFVVQSAADAVSGLHDAELVSDAQRPAYARYLRDAFGPRARKLGWTAKPTDDEDARLLRARIVPLVADEGEDAALAAEAQQLAAAWLGDHQAVDPDVVDGLLLVAAGRGDRGLFDRWLTAARTAPDQPDRQRLLLALSRFRDPTVIPDLLGILLTDTFDVRESQSLLWRVGRDPRGRRQAWQWLQAHIDALVARLPRDYGAYLPWLVAGTCDEGLVPEVKAFFGERAKKIEGGPRELAQALEELHLCAVYKTAQAPSVARFLSTWK